MTLTGSTRESGWGRGRSGSSGWGRGRSNPRRSIRGGSHGTCTTGSTTGISSPGCSTRPDPMEGVGSCGVNGTTGVDRATSRLTYVIWGVTTTAGTRSGGPHWGCSGSDTTWLRVNRSNDHSVHPRVGRTTVVRDTHGTHPHPPFLPAVGGRRYGDWGRDGCLHLVHHLR